MSSEEIGDEIVSIFPKDFWLNLEGEINASYLALFNEANKRFKDRPHYPYRMGHNRHFEREDALRRASEASSMPWRYIRPRGYPQVVVETPEYCLSETKVEAWGDLPKKTDQHLDLAAANPSSGFTHPTLPFFPEIIGDRKLAYVVVVNPPTSTKDGLPAQLGVGVPTANLDDWVFLATLAEIQLAYTDLPSAAKGQVDNAYPKLRLVPKTGSTDVDSDDDAG